MSAPFLRYPVEGGPAVLTGAPVYERSAFYYRRRHKDYLQTYPDGRTVLVNCDSVVTALRLEGGGRKTADPGPDHQNLGVALSGHAVPRARRPATPIL